MRIPTRLPGCLGHGNTRHKTMGRQQKLPYGKVETSHNGFAARLQQADQKKPPLDVPPSEMVGRVVVYSKPGCRYCRAAKFILEEHSIVYSEVDLTAFPERLPEMIRLSHGRSTVPQVRAGAARSHAW